MARSVYMDRDGEEIVVAWYQGIQPRKEKRFSDRRDAEVFADKKMGATGCIISTLDMTAEQLATHKERERRAKALWEAVVSS